MLTHILFYSEKIHIHQRVSLGRREVQRAMRALQTARRALNTSRNDLCSKLGTSVGEGLRLLAGVAKVFGGMRIRLCMGRSYVGAMPLHLRREMEELSDGVISNFAPGHIYELIVASQFRII